MFIQNDPGCGCKGKSKDPGIVDPGPDPTNNNMKLITWLSFALALLAFLSRK